MRIIKDGTYIEKEYAKKNLTILINSYKELPSVEILETLKTRGISVPYRES